MGAITDPFEHSAETLPDLEAPERARREEALQQVLDQLLSGATAHIGTTGRYALDGTAIESAARGKRAKGGEGGNPADSADAAAEALPKDVERGRAFDRDARWGYRTKTYDNKSNIMFGYQMMAFTRIGEVGGADQPLLTERIAVVPGNDKGLSQCLSVLDRLASADLPATEVVCDRGLSYAKAEDWAQRLADRGIEQVLDMHDSDRGSRPHEHGYLMIDGWAHCPSIPEHLVRIERPARFSAGTVSAGASAERRAEATKRQAEVDAFNAAIEERRQYRFERHGKSANGEERFLCPARAGKLACDACPLSQLLPPGTPTVQAPPAEEGFKACRQQTIVIKKSANPKLRQAEYWGSPEWQRSYARRTRVEGSFGLLKSPKGGNLRRGWTHQVGLVKTTLLLGLAVAATNLRQLLAWSARTGDTRDPLTQLDVTTAGFTELDPGAGAVGGVSPPGTA